MSSPLLKRLNVALLQFAASPIKNENFIKVESLVTKALQNKPNLDLIILPECFNSPYSIKLFKKYGEQIPSGETTQFLSQLSLKNKINIIGGSYPEHHEDKIYNTSTVFNTQGELIAKHRKAHLFNIDIPNKITFQESRVLDAGNKATLFELPSFGKIGLGICYDVRFPELSMTCARKGAFAMVFPSAFNTTTGPLHWETLARSRAIDNQVYVVMCSPARDLNAKYHAYGHSLVVDPMGKIVVEAGTEEEILYWEMDPEVINSTRQGIPIDGQRRFDIYQDVSETTKIGDV
ncbi:Nitrilase [Wickerhamomyces ciferrii]|uniref:Nitrilase n=1 Tax=Wickerhamomyces ciferrii (strain ATCC 14091 / BCRC 22168 / CBS 111 / JCM 3599 / NBRC 0793 / NRRL Y-1031 F-60-10) TaxID=1206466 RepID=K0KDF2_WICCF|nr:Nitrilase [Wickerhamomyces ciferrii]CCH43140.1 Nitrilase [Wickerhamomyces ciferrii]